MSASTSRPRRASQHKTPQKSDYTRPKRTRTLSLKAVESLTTESGEESDDSRNSVKDAPKATQTTIRRSARRSSPTKRYKEFVSDTQETRNKYKKPEPTQRVEYTDEDEEASDLEELPRAQRPELQLLQEEHDVAGRQMFGFNTPKKRDAMALAAMNTPQTPKTPKAAKTPRTPKTPKTSHTPKTPRTPHTPKTPKTPHTPKTPSLAVKTPEVKRRKSMTVDPKTPSHIRRNVKNQIAKLLETDSEISDFSGDESDFRPSDDDDSNSSTKTSDGEDALDDEPNPQHKSRRPIIVPVLPKTPSAARQRQTARAKKSAEYVPECESYFQSHASSKIHTSDHTLDRLKNPRLPAERIFNLLAEMKLCSEHESSINAMLEEYHSYFPKWMYILNEGFNLLLFGLGSKHQLLQSFHKQVLAQQTVLVVNGFFPSLTVKDILDSITSEILDAGPSAVNPHEAVDMIEEEFALIPETHLYLIVHNLDGVMLRNTRAQAIIARLAKVANIHLLASIDHINTPLLWDQTKLSQFNFSWWDVTTMLPYAAETAYENSLLVQNSGELALSSMRSVFSSLTSNARGIYMLIVNYQLKNKSNPNYPGMPFQDLYWGCREVFLVSSDLALRAQMTEFLDHKLVRTKRSVDGTELLTIPIESSLLQQFVEEQAKISS